MRLLDIHSHILPAVDDGAKNLAESTKLLEMLRQQGVTDVIATPHFSPAEDSIDEFRESVAIAKEQILSLKAEHDIPDLYFGCEVFYFCGMGSFEGIRELTINRSRYMLLEFGETDFGKTVCKDIIKMREEWGIIPIIAHIERYKIYKNYDALLELVKDGVCRSQVNATSLINNYFTKTAFKLVKKGLVDYIGTDAHSLDKRPPRIKEAYQSVENKFGKKQAEIFIRNGEDFLEEIGLPK